MLKMLLTQLSKPEALEKLLPLKCQVYNENAFSIEDVYFIRYYSGVCFAYAKLYGNTLTFKKRIKQEDFEKLKGYLPIYFNLKSLTDDSRKPLEQGKKQEMSKESITPKTSHKTKIEQLYKTVKCVDGKTRYFIFDNTKGRYYPISKKRLLSV